MQIAHVRRSIILLRIREFRSAPIGALLLLGNFLAQQFAHQLFQSVTVSIGAYQTRGSLGAIGRGGQNTQVMLNRCDIEPAELIELRSEEHTSELQSLMRISYAVFCLKNNKQQ